MFVHAGREEVPMDRELIEGLLGEGLSVEAIGRRVGKHRETVAYWMAKFGLEAPNREKHAGKGGIERERLEALVERGCTIAEIAAEVGLSKSGVRHWLGRYGLRTQNGVGRRRGIRQDGTPGPLTQCARHGMTEFVLEGRGYYRCKRCRAEGVTRHRRRLKQVLLAEAGGCCVICGYDRSPRALEFHHLDPTTKRLALSNRGVTVSLELLRAEASKCVVL